MKCLRRLAPICVIALCGGLVSAMTASLSAAYTGVTSGLASPLFATHDAIAYAAHAAVTSNGVVFTLKSVTRGPKVAKASYYIDTPPFGRTANNRVSMPLVGVTLTDAQGRVFKPQPGGGGTCVSSDRQLTAHEICHQSLAFLPPARGTHLTLTLTLYQMPPGRAKLPIGPWHLSFTMP